MAITAALAMGVSALGAHAQEAAPAATPPPPPPPPSGISEAVIAVVNDDIISSYDLTQRIRLILVTSGVQPTEENLPQLQREALRSLVDERLQLQEIRRVEEEQEVEIIPTRQEIDAEIDDIAKGNNMTGGQLVAALASQGVGDETLRVQLRAEISWQRWIQGRYGSRLRVGADQIEAARERLVQAAAKPQYQIGEIFIDAGRVGGMDQALQGAGQLVQQLQQGAPFPAVARQFSTAPSSAAGGDAGWISTGEMPAEVDAVLQQLRPGQLSAPIQVQDGVYIIYLREKRTGASATLINLKQAAVPLAGDASAADLAAARATLEALRPRVNGCENIEAAAADFEGVMAGDLGEAEVQDLAPAFREAAETLQTGQLSVPIRTPAGLHLVAVCGRRQSGGAIPTPEQVENRLIGQQLAMVSKRYLRDLRNSATIETR